MKMRKILALVLSVLMLASALAACGGGESKDTTPSTSAPTQTKSYQFYGKFEESG